MTTYLIRRLVYTLPILLGISLIVFVLFHVAGGNPVYRMLGKNASPSMLRTRAARGTRRVPGRT